MSAVREAEDVEVQGDVRQSHAFTVKSPEEHPAVSVLIRILWCITRYGKTFTPTQGGTGLMILVFSMSVVLAVPNSAWTLSLFFILITISHATYVPLNKGSSERARARHVSNSTTMEDTNGISSVAFHEALRPKVRDHRQQ